MEVIVIVLFALIAGTVTLRWILGLIGLRRWSGPLAMLMALVFAVVAAYWWRASELLS